MLLEACPPEEIPVTQAFNKGHKGKRKWHDNSNHENDFILVKFTAALPSFVNNYSFWW